jgi:Nucleoside 2-deoxyribosyltransferase/pfkB family carbohydrate kinase
MTTVVGGVYAERCLEPFWDDVYGSAGRAAAAISAAMPDVRLVTYRSADLADGLDNLAAVYGLDISGREVPQGIVFDYMHSLADPRITPRPDAISRNDDLIVEDDVVLRFGMLEGTARVKARRAVYDPQSAFDPRPFQENGSSADEVALIFNRLEGSRLTGETDADRIIDALIGSQDATVVVLKLGGHGAMVATKDSRQRIPAYRSDTVWKIGSGDVFSAAFTLFWAIDGRQPNEAADLASRAVAQYSATRALPIQNPTELLTLNAKPVSPGNGRVYIAAPFFNLAELWMVEEIRKRLLDMGVAVFSPLHDVGRGSASEVARRDLEGLDACDAVLAVLNGGDAGTIFEIGYAIAHSKPVIALAQNVRPEDLKMPEGTGCHIAQDFVTALYHAVWSLP